jgi:hypothetical protein
MTYQILLFSQGRESRFAVNNRLLITWKESLFRNNVTRRIFTVNNIFTVACCSKWNRANDRTLPVSRANGRTLPGTTGNNEEWGGW